jgi:hypothetical protein
LTLNHTTYHNRKKTSTNPPPVGAPTQSIPHLTHPTVTIALPIMCCFGDRENVEAKKSREIDALIHRDEKMMQRQVKLLLLGESLLVVCPYRPTSQPHMINGN